MALIAAVPLAAPSITSAAPSRPPRAPLAPAPNAPAPAPVSRTKAPLLVLSIDGLSWTRLQSSKAKLPNLRRLLARGAAGPLQSVFPSMTWPSHTAMITGRQPGRHGVIGNRWFDRARHETVQAWEVPHHDAICGDTLFAALSRARFRVGAVMWPSTSAARTLRWSLPEVYGDKAMAEGASAGLLAELDAAGLPVDRLDRITKDEAFELDSFSRDAATHLIATHRPDALFLHLLAYDTMAHRFGPDTRPATWALELCDRYLGDVLDAYHEAGLSHQLDVVVVSDHGFSTVDDGLSPRYFERDLRLPKADAERLQWVQNGQTLWLYETEAGAGAKGKRARAAARRRASKRPSPLEVALAALAKDERVITIYRPVDLEALGLGALPGQPRAPDAVALVKTNIMLWNPSNRRREHRPPWRGMHGGAPEADEMQGVFLAAGPRFAARARLRAMGVVDLAPTLAAALGARLDANVRCGGQAKSGLDGSVRREALALPR